MFLGLFQFELVAELFTDTEEVAKGRVQALKQAPKGSNKQMKKTVGSQVKHHC